MMIALKLCISNYIASNTLIIPLNDLNYDYAEKCPLTTSYFMTIIVVIIFLNVKVMILLLTVIAL